MIGLIGIDVALLLGTGMRIAAVTGAIMVTLMWSASLPPSDHIVYAIVLLGLAVVGALATRSASAPGGPEPVWSVASPWLT